MIESSTLKLIMKAAPNYHLVSEKFARESFGVCTCGKCTNCVHGKTGASKARHECSGILKRLTFAGLPTGYAKVDEFGTCDAAKFIPEDYSNFKLEHEETK